MPPNYQKILCEKRANPKFQAGSIRLWHMKNNGVRLSHALSRNSEAMDVHTTNQVGVWGGMQWLFLLQHHSFFLLQWDVQTIIKLILKQASKEFQKEFHREKNTSKASQNGFFTFISRFHKVCGDLKLLQNGFHERNIVFSDQICIE